MKHNAKRLTALLLALNLVLALTACGKGGDGDTQQLSGTVYVPKFIDVEIPKVDYINTGCISGDYVYIQAERGEEEEIRDEETGDVYYNYTYVEELYRISLDGGAAVKLENFQLTEIPESGDAYTEGNVYVSGISAGSDGTIWVTESMYINTYELPEDFDEETDSVWNYPVTTQECVIRRQLDSTGNTITSITVENLAEKLGLDYAGDNAFGEDGTVYVQSDGKIYVLDAQLNKLFELDFEGEDIWGSFTNLGGGVMGLLYSIYDPDKGTSTNGIKIIDLEAKDWGADYRLPYNVYSILAGGGDYLFYYQIGEGMYGYKVPEGSAPGEDGTTAGEGERLFSWIDSDINRSDLSFFDFTDDGRVVAVSQNRRSGSDASVQLAVLTAADRSTLEEKTTLTYAVMWLGYYDRRNVIEFNRRSDKYRIEVRDYSEFNTEEDYNAGLTRLNTEITTGNVPDILNTSGLPLRQYGAKGLLEDLWPYIEGDTEIGGRAGVMERVLQANEVDGKLYEIFNSFYIQTVVGARRIVGDRMSWTMADMQEALAQMPEGCTYFGEGDTKTSMLQTVLNKNANSFVDWGTGECHFDSDSFKALLEFCNSFPDEYNPTNEDGEWIWVSPESRIVEGKQMLMDTNISDLHWGVAQTKAVYQGDISFVGYPMEDGSVGSNFCSSSSGVAMSATCKDKEGAWTFIRQVLLPRSEDEFYEQFYVNKSDFDKAIAQSMEPNYQYDENGEKILGEDGQPLVYEDSWWISEDLQITVSTPGQAEYDQLMELYNAIDSMYYNDENITEIVNDVAGGYFSGDRTLEDTVNQIQSRVKIYVNENR